MAKVWEETWVQQRYVVEMAGDSGRHLGQFVDDEDDPDDPGCDRDRAQLAAAAPEMARLLLELEWAGGFTYPYDTGTTSCCPVCTAEPSEGHEKDCKLVAVLVKAGVRAS